MPSVAIRKLSRLGNELHLTGALATAALIPGHQDRGVVLALLLKRCLTDWLAEDRFVRPTKITEFTTINSIATSLNKPYVTMHRTVHRLIRDGWVIQRAAGVALANTPAVSQAIIKMMCIAHDSFVRLAEDFSDDVEFAETNRQPVIGLRKMILAAALDTWLVPYEYADKPVTDWTSKFVWLVIFVANVRHITIDPILSKRYAVEPTPDSIRIPINVRKIARVSGIAYATVFRHCQALAALDVVRYDREGWVLVSRQFLEGEVDQGVNALLDYFEKRISELVHQGFSVKNAALFYINGRPPYGAIDD